MRKLPDASYAKHYTEQGFWDWCGKIAKRAGYETIVKFFELYYVLTSGKSSAATKAIVLAALGYGICPIDAIPDFIPALGLSDDAAVAAAAIYAVNNDITPEITKKAEDKVNDLVR